MKLSEAIRLGAMLNPNSTDTWEGCAVGAALLAIGQKFTNPMRQVCEIWPWTDRVLTDTENPMYPYVYDSISVGKKIPAQLHALHADGWTRERIADWVATIEPKENHDLQPLADESGNEVHQVQQEAIQGRQDQM